MVEERIDMLKNQMEEEGMKMTDTSPLSKIKASIAQLKKEVANLDIKIGVINHHLLKYRIVQTTVQYYLVTLLPCHPGSY
jgi:estrogen-related receptor beta like 1